ncbi:transcriptional regulator [Burkholderiales bacterium JOSHI_001]|nr:transcriptional regulator [Burkholderiales bacterium JOSHI_001]
MGAYNPTVARLSFREKVLQAREDAIVEAVNRLLAEKGFDLMTVDEVAAAVGIAKASLYKHFPSKELLAAAAMVRVMALGLERAQAEDAAPGARPLDKLKAVTRWTLATLLAGQMPSLPSQNSSLRATLVADKRYVDLLMTLSDLLGGWIEQALAEGDLVSSVPPELILYTLYARACDPVLGVMKAGGQYSDEQIIDGVMTTCFDGLRTR